MNIRTDDIIKLKQGEIREPHLDSLCQDTAHRYRPPKWIPWRRNSEENIRPWRVCVGFLMTPGDFSGKGTGRPAVFIIKPRLKHRFFHFVYRIISPRYSVPNPKRELMKNPPNPIRFISRIRIRIRSVSGKLCLKDTHGRSISNSSKWSGTERRRSAFASIS